MPIHIVTGDTLEGLLVWVSAEEQNVRYLAGGPLMIPSACETGPARNLPQVKLQDSMFQPGAQGVVVARSGALHRTVAWPKADSHVRLEMAETDSSRARQEAATRWDMVAPFRRRAAQARRRRVGS